jgi:hypothetical protein
MDTLVALYFVHQHVTGVVFDLVFGLSVLQRLQTGRESHFRWDKAFSFCYTVCNKCKLHCDYNMTLRHTDDKQLQGITLESVLEKRRLDQALNAKEFAVCAGVSYSTARSWFHLVGFPVFHGVIFWQDFVRWRTDHTGLAGQPENLPHHNGKTAAALSTLPPRAAQILLDSHVETQ